MSKEGVLVVTHPLAPASESHVESLLSILSAITSVALVTTNLSSESSIREEYPVCEISGAGVGQSIVIAAFRFLRNQFRMCRVIASRDEEIVLFFGATAYLLPIAFARLMGRTVVLEPRGNVPLTLRLQWEQRVPNFAAHGLAGIVWCFERSGYWLADAIIAYTSSMADELGLRQFDTKLHPTGARYIDTEQFSPQVTYEKREKIVGFLGRLDEEKNVRMLAEVAAMLSEDVTFRFIGDGELRTELEQKLTNEIEAGTVEFTGWISHERVPKALSELQLLVLPSEPTEGLPTVIYESMSCGTPVYASAVSGVPDIVHDGETGFLMECVDSVPIAKKIELILKRDDLTDVSQNARTHIENNYSFTSAVDRYQKIFNEL